MTATLSARLGSEICVAISADSEFLMSGRFPRRSVTWHNARKDDIP